MTFFPLGAPRGNCCAIYCDGVFGRVPRLAFEFDSSGVK